jgi:hypothetical protein
VEVQASHKTPYLLTHLFSSCPQVSPAQEEVAARLAGQGRVPDDGERTADQCAHRIERGDCTPEPARRRPRWCAVEPRHGTERYPASGRIEPAHVLSACEHQCQSSRREQAPACCRASPLECGPPVAPVAPGTPSRRYGRTWLWILKGNRSLHRPLHLPTSILVSSRPVDPWMHLPTSITTTAAPLPPHRITSCFPYNMRFFCSSSPGVSPHSFTHTVECWVISAFVSIVNKIHHTGLSFLNTPSPSPRFASCIIRPQQPTPQPPNPQPPSI